MSEKQPPPIPPTEEQKKEAAEIFKRKAAEVEQKGTDSFELSEKAKATPPDVIPLEVFRPKKEEPKPAIEKARRFKKEDVAKNPHIGLSKAGGEKVLKAGSKEKREVYKIRKVRVEEDSSDEKLVESDEPKNAPDNDLIEEVGNALLARAKPKEPKAEKAHKAKERSGGRARKIEKYEGLEAQPLMSGLDNLRMGRRRERGEDFKVEKEVKEVRENEETRTLTAAVGTTQETTLENSTENREAQKQEPTVEKQPRAAEESFIATSEDDPHDEWSAESFNEFTAKEKERKTKEDWDKLKKLITDHYGGEHSIEPDMTDMSGEASEPPGNAIDVSGPPPAAVLPERERLITLPDEPQIEHVGETHRGGVYDSSKWTGRNYTYRPEVGAPAAEVVPPGTPTTKGISQNPMYDLPIFKPSGPFAWFSRPKNRKGLFAAALAAVLGGEIVHNARPDAPRAPGNNIERTVGDQLPPKFENQLPSEAEGPKFEGQLPPDTALTPEAQQQKDEALKLQLANSGHDNWVTTYTELFPGKAFPGDAEAASQIYDKEVGATTVTQRAQYIKISPEVAGTSSVETGTDQKFTSDEINTLLDSTGEKAAEGYKREGITTATENQGAMPEMPIASLDLNKMIPEQVWKEPAPVEVAPEPKTETVVIEGKKQSAEDILNMPSMNKFNVPVYPNKPHIYDDGKALVVYGGSFDERSKRATEFVDKNPGAAVLMKFEKDGKTEVYKVLKAPGLEGDVLTKTAPLNEPEAKEGGFFTLVGRELRSAFKRQPKIDPNAFRRMVE